MAALKWNEVSLGDYRYRGLDHPEGDRRVTIAPSKDGKDLACYVRGEAEPRDLATMTGEFFTNLTPES